MDVNVVVVVYVNTGHPTQLHHRTWPNLRLKSFSRLNARPQEFYRAPLEKRVFTPAGNGFTHHKHLFKRGTMRQPPVDIWPQCAK
jgi:hypothetical protein